MYVCMYVCMYACMYGCMYVCMYVCVCVYVCIRVSTYAAHDRQESTAPRAPPSDGVAQQERRAAVSIPLSILEGP